jgi:uncharacterized protein with ATP-grasp and redox domains
MVHELTKPEIRKKAVSALTRWLRRNAENKEITPGVADFRLRQLTEIVPEADRSSEPFIETKKAVETYRQQAKEELPEPT